MHRAITEGIRTTVLYSIVCWPLFVLGVHLASERGIRRLGTKLLETVSWVCVCLSAGLPLLAAGLVQSRAFGYFHKDFIFPWEFTWVAFASPMVLCALLAGVSYSRRSERKWVALMPVIVGVLAQGLLFAYFRRYGTG